MAKTHGDEAGISFAQHVFLHCKIFGEPTIRELATYSDEGRISLHFIRELGSLIITEQEARFLAQWLIERADAIKALNSAKA